MTPRGALDAVTALAPLVVGVWLGQAAARGDALSHVVAAAGSVLAVAGAWSVLVWEGRRAALRAAVVRHPSARERVDGVPPWHPEGDPSAVPVLSLDVFTGGRVALSTHAEHGEVVTILRQVADTVEADRRGDP